MAVKFEFYLSDKDADRLLAVKEDKGKNTLTGNEFARELLEGVLHQLHPLTVRYDEDTGLRIREPEEERTYQTVKEAIENGSIHPMGFTVTWQEQWNLIPCRRSLTIIQRF